MIMDAPPPRKRAEHLTDRPHLVLIASFPTNHEILDEFVRFLRRRFEVHFVDLPGFHPEEPRITERTLEAYLAHLRKRIEKLGLASYILGGISFGFLLASQLEDERCTGLLAIEPTIGSVSLRLTALERMRNRLLVTAARLGLHSTIWRSAWFRKAMERSLCPAEHVDATLSQIDPKAFFDALGIILMTKKVSLASRKPVCLIVNRDDAVVSTPVVKETFITSYPRLLILETTMDHYPANITQSHFERHFPKKMIDRIESFLKGREEREAAQQRPRERQLY